MPQQRVNGNGGSFNFVAGQVNSTMTVANEHNVAGNIVYRITPPGQNVTVQVAANEPDIQIGSINGNPMLLTNNLPNSVLCTWPN